MDYHFSNFVASLEELRIRLSYFQNNQNPKSKTSYGWQETGSETDSESGNLPDSRAYDLGFRPTKTRVMLEERELGSSPWELSAKHRVFKPAATSFFSLSVC